MSNRKTEIYVVDSKWFKEEAKRIEKELEKYFGRKPTQSFIAYIMARKSSRTRIMTNAELNKLILDYEGKTWK